MTIHRAAHGWELEPDTEDGIILNPVRDALSEIEIKKRVRRSRGGKRKKVREKGSVVTGPCEQKPGSHSRTRSIPPGQVHRAPSKMALQLAQSPGLKQVRSREQQQQVVPASAI